MAGNSKRELEIIQQMQLMGVWQEAFRPSVHQLVVMERELSRTMKDWRAAEPDKNKPSPVQHPLYAIVQSQRKDILALRDSLGLTPKGLRKLRGANVPESGTSPEGFGEKLDRLMAGLASLETVSL